MDRSRVLLLLSCVLFLSTLASCRTVFPGNRAPLVIDATRMINDSLPGDLDDRLHPQRGLHVNTQTVGKEGYEKQTHIMAGGSGTHMDAPSHVCGGAWVVCATPAPYRTIDEARTDELIGPLRVIDVKAKAAANPNYMVTVQDLQLHVQQYGRIPKDAWVAMDSGWSRYAYDEAAYKNVGSDGLNHFPGWSGAAVQWLIDNTQFNGIAVDTLSVDKGESFSYEAHFANMGSNHFAVESLDLSDPRIPPKGAWLILAPSKIQDAPEAPTRALILL